MLLVYCVLELFDRALMSFTHSVDLVLLVSTSFWKECDISGSDVARSNDQQSCTPTLAHTVPLSDLIDSTKARAKTCLSNACTFDDNEEGYIQLSKNHTQI